jgi:YHS domain-containing protein
MEKKRTALVCAGVLALLLGGALQALGEPHAGHGGTVTSGAVSETSVQGRSAFQVADGAGAGRMCPVMGGAVDREVFLDYKGQRVYFCCDGCKDVFLKDPDGYLEKWKSDAGGKAGHGKTS